MPTMEVDFLAINCSSVIVTACRLLAKCLGLTSAYKVVKIKYVEII